jgi:hypothetical protein
MATNECSMKSKNSNIYWLTMSLFISIWKNFIFMLVRSAIYYFVPGLIGAYRQAQCLWNSTDNGLESTNGHIRQTLRWWDHEAKTYMIIQYNKNRLKSNWPKVIFGIVWKFYDKKWEGVQKLRFYRYVILEQSLKVSKCFHLQIGTH